MNGKTIFIAVILAGIFYAGGQYIASQPQRVQKEAAANREITVQGTGKVQAKPDIAKISLGVTTGPQSTAAIAMNLLSQKINTVLVNVKQQGVKEDDLKTTNLSVNPVYDYSAGKQTLKGFEATENVEVKIRNLSKVGDVVAKATVDGVNQIGGIQFVVDNSEKLQTEAQKNAIEDAESKAKELARALNVKLGNVKSFSTENQNETPRPLYNAVGMGGSESKVASPEIASGTNEIISNVSIVFELR